MSIDILLASSNAQKLAEFRRMLEPLGFRVVSPADIGLDLRVDETGSTFRDNARLKAEAFSRLTGRVAIADDSGLAVDALQGEPGVRSARYGGPAASDDDRNGIVLEKLRHVNDEARGARFVAAIGVAIPGGETQIVEGTVEGWITRKRRGSNGFGYDPIFLYPPMARTFGELPAADKDAVSHRGQALRQAAQVLTALVQNGILS